MRALGTPQTTEAPQANSEISSLRSAGQATRCGGETTILFLSHRGNWRMAVGEREGGDMASPARRRGPNGATGESVEPEMSG